ncbi:MAG TPA: VRR-NUC domain-containing protein [Abditibacteriaceae bacterium]
MQIPLFCGRCSSQLEYSDKSQRATCPKCSGKCAGNGKGSSTDKATKSKKPKAPKEALTPAQQAIKDAHRGLRRTKRFQGGHGILVPEEIPESVIQQSIMEHFFANGWLVVRINSGSMKTSNGGYLRAYRIFGMPEKWASSGLPDVVAFRGSRALLIEVKDRLGQLRDTQVRFIEFAERFNVKVHVMRNWQSAEELTKEMIAREANRPTRADWLRLQMVEMIARRELGERLEELVKEEIALRESKEV